MIKLECPECHRGNDKVQMVTISRWYGNDVSYETRFRCSACGYRTSPIAGRGLFPVNQEWRSVQTDFRND